MVPQLARWRLYCARNTFNGLTPRQGCGRFNTVLHNGSQHDSFLPKTKTLTRTQYSTVRVRNTCSLGERRTLPDASLLEKNLYYRNICSLCALRQHSATFLSCYLVTCEKTEYNRATRKFLGRYLPRMQKRAMSWHSGLAGWMVLTNRLDHGWPCGMSIA